MLRKILYFFIVLWFIGATYSVYELATQEDMLKPMLSKLSRDSQYSMYHPSNDTNVLGYGRLGDFYDCLHNYRDIGGRRSVGEGVSHFDIRFDDGTFLSISGTKTQTYQVTPGLVRNGDKKYFGSYALNCDIALLFQKN